MSETKGTTVCLTGHNPQTLTILDDENSLETTQLRKVLKKSIIELIETENAKHFISGMSLGIDMMCAEIVLELKEEYPFITLECALPYETQAIRWRVESQEKYYFILRDCDKDTMLQTRYTSDCISKRNKYMVDKSDIILAVWNGSNSGTGNIINYARKINKTIKQIAC